MPLGKYANFEDCQKSISQKINKRTGKPYGMDAAKKVCGAIQQKVEGKNVELSDFTSFIDVECSNFELKSDDKGNFFVDFDLTTDDMDNYKTENWDGDIVSSECQDDMVAQLVGKDMKIKMGVEHDVYRQKDKTLLPHAKIVKAVKTKEEGKSKIKATAMLNKHHPDFNTLKGSIEDKFLDATSIEYKALDFTIKKVGEKTARVLNKVLLGGVTFTGRALNPAAKITDFYVKSQEAYEEFLDVQEEIKSMENEIDIIKKPSEVKTMEPIEEKKGEETISIPKKEFEEMKALLDEKKAKERDNALAEQVKSYVKEELKSIEPQLKMLADQAGTGKDGAGKFDEVKANTEIKLDVRSQFNRVFGVQ